MCYQHDCVLTEPSGVSVTEDNIQVFDKDDNFKFQFAEVGKDNVVDTSYNRRTVSDTEDNIPHIEGFDKDGNFKFQFGEVGKKDGQLLYPNRVSPCPLLTHGHLLFAKMAKRYTR